MPIAWPGHISCSGGLNGAHQDPKEQKERDPHTHRPSGQTWQESKKDFFLAAFGELFRGVALDSNWLAGRKTCSWRVRYLTVSVFMLYASHMALPDRAIVLGKIGYWLDTSPTCGQRRRLGRRYVSIAPSADSTDTYVYMVK
jgi:hypothetical protein